MNIHGPPILKAEHEIKTKMQQQQQLLLSLESATDPEIKKASDWFKKYEEAAILRLKDFEYQLQQGINALSENRVQDAVTHLDSARTYERQLQSLLKGLKKLEGKILNLIKRDQKQAK